MTLPVELYTFISPSAFFSKSYVRDDRPAGDTAAPAVWFAYSPDRKGEHPERHLKKFHGTLQADAYAGFNQLYQNGCIHQAACWAHVRRKFYDLEQAHASPVAREALQRIGALYGIEDTMALPIQAERIPTPTNLPARKGMRNPTSTTSRPGITHRTWDDS